MMRQRQKYCWHMVKPAEKLWKEMSIRQGDESFGQFSLRVQRRLEQFQKLAVNENSDLVKTLVKYTAIQRYGRPHSTAAL